VTRGKRTRSLTPSRALMINQHAEARAGGPDRSPQHAEARAGGPDKKSAPEWTEFGMTGF